MLQLIQYIPFFVGLGLVLYVLLNAIIPLSTSKRGGLRFIRFHRYTVTVSKRRR